VVRQIDNRNGSFWPAYKHLGEPRFPTGEQYRELRKAAELLPVQSRDWNGGVVNLTLPAHALALVEIETDRTSQTPSRPARHTKSE
jgi:beta-xylosidase